MDSKANELFVQKIENDLIQEIKHNKVSIEKIASGFAIYNKNLIKELTELAIVRISRSIAHTYDGLSNYDKFQKIVDLYKNQANLSQRTSQSMLLQQYSTPAPISYIASLYVYSGDPKSIYLEPSAGNGLLTIALPCENTFVNELDDIRLANLRTQPFAKIESQDATIPFTQYFKYFDGIITNPPFGTLMEAQDYDGFPIKTLDHLMALRALDTMKDAGRAAIIIGGHTDWDEQGRIQAGKNRLFFNYLYSHYNVEDVILIDGHKLYSRQGTSFDVRLILINGRKAKPKGFSPLKNSLISEVIYDFDKLWSRVFDTGITVKNPIEEVDSKVKSNERFTETKYVDRSLITVRPELFQGRIEKFSQDTVDKIVREGYDKSQDPIAVWWDDEIKKYDVISGHSRWEASRILYEKGDTSLEKMPVKVFIGDKDDAIDYAVLESNRSGTAEGLLSDIKAYKRAVSKGFNRDKLKSLFKPESYLHLLQSLSFLNERGLFVEYLNQPSEQSFPYLKRNAQWVGLIRKQIPLLSDSHETEIFNFLYKGDKKNLDITKERFWEIVERKVGAIDFNPDQPLNLKSVISPNAYSDPIRDKIKEIEKEITDIERQRSYNENLIVRAKQENKPEFIPKFKEKISQLNNDILAKLEEKKKLEIEISKVEREINYDLFTPVPEALKKDDAMVILKLKIKMKSKAIQLENF